MKRRLEVRAEVAGVTVIDDFAHHPTAIRETLRALRAAYSGRRLWAVLEPRSNTLRRNVFERELVESLSLADEVVLAGVFKSDAIPVLERLEPSHVVEALLARGVPAVLCADADAIVSEIVPRVRYGDVIAILSNGGFGGIYEKLPGPSRRVRTSSAAATARQPFFVHNHARYPCSVCFLRFGCCSYISFSVCRQTHRDPMVRVAQGLPHNVRLGMKITGLGPKAAGARARLEGLENVQPGVNYIFLSNHVSNLDAPLLLPSIPGMTSVFIKRELMKVPFLATAMRMGKYVPVSRGNSREDAQRSVDAAADALNSGLHMTIFPEGTRSPDGRLCRSRKAHSSSPSRRARQSFPSSSLAQNA